MNFWKSSKRLLSIWDKKIILSEMVQKGPDRPKRITFKVGPNHLLIFVNGEFVALCVSVVNSPWTILFKGRIQNHSPKRYVQVLLLHSAAEKKPFDALGRTLCLLFGNWGVWPGWHKMQIYYAFLAMQLKRKTLFPNSSFSLQSSVALWNLILGPLPRPLGIVW